MKIIPAIDLVDGKCVRLSQGDYDKKKVYRDNPVEVAKEFEAADLDHLHLVDLDGAKKGEVVNWKVIGEILNKTALHVDFGGGVKTTDDVDQLLELGINRINIGSVAVKEPEKFKGWMKEYGPENFILGADVRNENVQINGWQEGTDMNLYDLISQYEPLLKYAACTDIDTDGMLSGPNLGLYKKIKNRFPHLKVIASGGISSIEDIKQLQYIDVDAVVIGKALYEGEIKLEELKPLTL
ncbi:MAG TPA: 1-(5-phosphoribosyl)-5-[(5-phosphoribosylamino)methylideneamino]imidazole-4-carboxamide isomerase [Cyclobacteriaceae bacterium]|nr:1-(5-phosphoribosyl)-5-[(5-phosphoribosylamino)methylideneamino]imidazole-4-carboxamide isomerase [Cyclobacteriaceae bacterium]MCB9236544.1 1-(5-phosphoribosyl)-5-[(5-phosphoribosylamino)methylideneamino]imidazole-4-carboxamide isomerase [Flammeovirgaceae bacterium]MCB0500671.1 1-(5-phosphoribosyl)-5-[(5-phosphoribosylamino)methylideneamino]imidazole-4-carboxamide isomerase [Cyclobacteriaceae bacterium]MCO5273023.1 1-(5-phosphoribosyl)-5-[(5-phosphoribosylamino)methylideneamino]imidazole-4-ca